MVDRPEQDDPDPSLWTATVWERLSLRKMLDFDGMLGSASAAGLWRVTVRLSVGLRDGTGSRPIGESEWDITRGQRSIVTLERLLLTCLRDVIPPYSGRVSVTLLSPDMVVGSWICEVAIGDDPVVVGKRRGKKRTPPDEYWRRVAERHREPLARVYLAAPLVAHGAAAVIRAVGAVGPLSPPVRRPRRPEDYAAIIREAAAVFLEQRGASGVDGGLQEPTDSVDVGAAPEPAETTAHADDAVADDLWLGLGDDVSG